MTAELMIKTEKPDYEAKIACSALIHIVRNIGKLLIFTAFDGNGGAGRTVEASAADEGYVRIQNGVRVPDRPRLVHIYLRI